MRGKKYTRALHAAFCGLALLGAVSSTGCQITESGQTLPSPWYVLDDVQYFAPGPDHKLAREAAAMKEAKAEQALLQ
ncbi:MAG: hypothetical protein QGG36_08685 [Pirellulaceae bacterium]|nr:hypothetical protein [Pirellulaceae bacterium]